MNAQTPPASLGSAGIPAGDNALQLADIHLPAQPDWWPPAPGWWLLAALLLAALTHGVIRALRWRKRRRQQQMIDSTLAELRQQFARGETQAAIAGLNRLLRALALMHFPREETASLTGEQWLAFLDRGAQTHDFSQGPGRVLGEGPYQTHAPKDLDTDALLRLTRRWIDAVTRGEEPVKPLYDAPKRRRWRAA